MAIDSPPAPSIVAHDAVKRPSGSLPAAALLHLHPGSADVSLSDPSVRKEGSMTETRAVAKLPNLDIEILHRRLPDEEGEQLAISLKAYPWFDAFARFYGTSGPFGPWLALNPMLAWPALLQAMYAPWWAALPRIESGAERPPGRDG